MPKMSKARALVVLLFIVTFLGTRLMGLHLHLCFDGTEPPASVQAQTHDLGENFGSGAMQAPMQDLDIDLTGDILTKLAKAVAELPVVVAAVAFFFLHSSPSPGFPRARAEVPVSGRAPRIRPPLRAPPC